MNQTFSFDVFIIFSGKDRPVVRPLAARLRRDGLRVWFDEWQLKQDDDIIGKTEEGLEHSRVLVLCVSESTFGSDWTSLESSTFRFRDPVNRNRSFIPLRLDNVAIRGFLTQYAHIDWSTSRSVSSYKRLLDACSIPRERERHPTPSEIGTVPFRIVPLGQRAARIHSYAFNRDGARVLIGGFNGIVQTWDLKSRECLKELQGATSGAQFVGWSSDLNRAVSASNGFDQRLRIWNIETGTLLHASQGQQVAISDLAVSVDGSSAAIVCEDSTIRTWNLKSGDRLKVIKSLHGDVSVAWDGAGEQILTGGLDRMISRWNVQTGECLRTYEGHNSTVLCLAWSSTGAFALSGSRDQTLRVWDIELGRCQRVFEGHKGTVSCVAWGPNERYVLSGSEDQTVRLWDVDSGRCLSVFEGHESEVIAVMWGANGRSVFSGDEAGVVRIWDISQIISGARRKPIASGQVQYLNAKVLLVGETGVGKTGLSRRLVSGTWEPSDSTIGAWASQWKLPATRELGVEREIWLWDFGGQADQRLIHQLYMDETALAVFVIDGQKEDLFETLSQWDRDLSRAARMEFNKILVVGRIDAGGLRVNKHAIKEFVAKHKFRAFLETSAKENLGCDHLKEAILTTIDWENLPCRSTEPLFRRLKGEIVRIKDEGRVLMRLNELRETLRLRLPTEFRQFSDEELDAVLRLLAGPGVVWQLAFGSWVLLQPELINTYAQAVIRTVQADEQQRGCVMEEQVLKGDLLFPSTIPRIAGDEERFVLLAMHQTLIERGLCLREPTAKGTLLVLPNYYRRERADQVRFPNILVNFRFRGFLDEIYATLVVRLHYTESFQQDQLWRYAADFKTNTNRRLGIKLTRSGPGEGEIAVYFDQGIPIEEKIIFSKYVHEHLLSHASDVVRLRNYICPYCDTPVGNRETAMGRLNEWLQIQPELTTLSRPLRAKRKLPSIICVECLKQVPLWDELEQCFASPQIRQRVRDLQEETTIVLSNQNKERTLVGEVISTVALAGQISREFNVCDQGIDMEIEFANDAHQATGRKLYLQLKSGDSYLYERRRDGKEIFTIREERHARYWMDQAFPVMLVIRDSDGEIRWMEVRDWLLNASDGGRKRVNQIVFEGERFDVMSVRRWRERTPHDNWS